MKKFKCYSCKKYFQRKKVLIHVKKILKKSGVLRIYFVCTYCNTLRLKKYRHTESGKFNSRKAVYKSIKKHIDKQKARWKLYRNIRSGKIIKPKSCVCGNSPVEGHHEDYSKPLEVKWLCRSCHSNLHRIKATPSS